MSPAEAVSSGDDLTTVPRSTTIASDPYFTALVESVQLYATRAGVPELAAAALAQEINKQKARD